MRVEFSAARKLRLRSFARRHAEVVDGNAVVSKLVELESAKVEPCKDVRTCV